MSTPNIADETERYVRTGDADMDARAGPGDFMERGRRQHAGFITCSMSTATPRSFAQREHGRSLLRRGSGPALRAPRLHRVR